MKKQFVLLFLAVANIVLASDKEIQPKTVLTFPIMISEQGNPVKTDGFLPDEMDKFSCGILKISWPEKMGEKLWSIKKTTFTKADSPHQHTATAISMEYCIDDPKVINPTTNNRIIPFPTALPDSFVESLVKQREITHEFPNSTIRFVLENSEESLKKLGLLKQQRITQVPVADKNYEISESSQMKVNLNLQDSANPQLSENSQTGPNSGKTPTSYFSLRNIVCFGVPVGLVGLFVWLWAKKAA